MWYASYFLLFYVPVITYPCPIVLNPLRCFLGKSPACVGADFQEACLHIYNEAKLST